MFHGELSSELARRQHRKTREKPLERKWGLRMVEDPSFLRGKVIRSLEIPGGVCLTARVRGGILGQRALCHTEGS